MAKLACDFIPRARASWFCPRCDAHYSETCIPDGFNPLWGRDGPRCILCHSDLININDPSVASPFWHKLPYFFAYPLHFNALLIIALGTGGVWLLGGGIPSLIYLVIWSLMTVKYFFAVIAERAAGKRWPPSLLELIKSDNHYLFLQAILLHLALGALVAAAAVLTAKYSIPHSFWVILGLSALITFAYPAMIMLLAVTKSLWQAMSLGMLVRVITAMGFSYLLLWVLLLIMGGISSLVGYLLYPLLPTEWVLPASVGVGSYFSFVTYGLMGYAVFQYREDIGLNEDIDESGEELDERSFRRAQALGAVRVLHQRGELDRARQELRGLLDICRDEPDLHHQYQQLLLEIGDEKALPRHTDYYADLLITHKRPKEAAAVVLETLQRLPDYRPASLSLVLALAPALTAAKQHRQLAQLLGNVHKTHAADPQLPEAYLLLADTLAGPLKQPDKARQLVLFMLKRYPDMTCRREYEKKLKKLRS